ncbi:MAG: hypothetical protein BVN35_01490 [Proteobacteria bacterium ST_bin11]|nr:MAG: hypothetical protein BVN35_01490 [Proteobacteria bacterium ST_bin11]
MIVEPGVAGNTIDAFAQSIAFVLNVLPDRGGQRAIIGLHGQYAVYCASLAPFARHDPHFSWPSARSTDESRID